MEQVEVHAPQLLITQKNWENNVYWNMGSYWSRGTTKKKTGRLFPPSLSSRYFIIPKKRSLFLTPITHLHYEGRTTFETKENWGPHLCSLGESIEITTAIHNGHHYPFAGLRLTNEITSLLDVTSSNIFDRMMATTDLGNKHTPFDQLYHIPMIWGSKGRQKNEESIRKGRA